VIYHIKVIGVNNVGKDVVILTKKKSAGNKPAQSMTCSKLARSGVRGIAKTVDALTTKQHYRGDLKKVNRKTKKKWHLCVGCFGSR
jgi:hypothetical protein